MRSLFLYARFGDVKACAYSCTIVSMNSLRNCSNEFLCHLRASRLLVSQLRLTLMEIWIRLPCQPSHAPDQYRGLFRVQSATIRFRKTPAKRNLRSYELPFLFQVFCAIDVKEDRCGVVLITLSAKPLYKVPESGLLKPLVFCVS